MNLRVGKARWMGGVGGRKGNGENDVTMISKNKNHYK